jgi:hypothetical protein
MVEPLLPSPQKKSVLERVLLFTKILFLGIQHKHETAGIKEHSLEQRNAVPYCSICNNGSFLCCINSGVAYFVHTFFGNVLLDR